MEFGPSCPILIHLLQEVRQRIFTTCSTAHRSHQEGGFQLDKDCARAFDRLKEVMNTYPVLALPDFTQPFVLECDASGEGVGAILMQGGHPIAFKSRKLLPHERLYLINDKEMLGIMHALAKFRQYVVGNNFRVRTDHNNLRLFLE